MHNMYGSYSDFLLAWECVDDDLIFFFGWTYPLIVVICEMQWTNISRHELKKLCSILNQHYVYIRLLNRYSKSVFGNLYRTLKTRKRKVSSSLKSLNVNMLPVYRTTHLSSHIHSYYDWKRLFYSTKGPNGVQTPLRPTSKRHKSNHCDCTVFSSRAKLGLADFMGTLGLINLEWSVYCQTTGFI